MQLIKIIIETAPKLVRIFINKPTMSFDDAENTNPTEVYINKLDLMIIFVGI